MNFSVLQIPVLIVVTCQTFRYLLAGNLTIISTKWLMIVILNQLEPYTYHNFLLPYLLVSSQIVVIFDFWNIAQLVYNAIESTPLDNIIQELQYYTTYVLTVTVVKLFKVCITKLLQWTENPAVNDERFSKLSQSLADVSMFIDQETNKRADRSFINQSFAVDQSQILNTTLKLDLDKIEQSRKELESERLLQAELQRLREAKLQEQRQIEQQEKIRIQKEKKQREQQEIQKRIEEEEQQLLLSRMNQTVTYDDFLGEIPIQRHNSIDSMRKMVEQLNSERKEIQIQKPPTGLKQVETKLPEQQKAQKSEIVVNEKVLDLFDKLRQSQDRLRVQQQKNQSLNNISKS